MERLKGIWRPLNLPSVYSKFQDLLGAAAYRERLVECYLKIQPGERILDVGCGPGDILNFLPEVDYIGIDINPSYIAKARKVFGNRGQFLVADVGTA
jgi:ubiquinone/menaquinone biosynthesis C-methylase UbiE